MSQKLVKEEQQSCHTPQQRGYGMIRIDDIITRNSSFLIMGLLHKYKFLRPKF